MKEKKVTISVVSCTLHERNGGGNFVMTVREIAKERNITGPFRVLLNGREIFKPSQAPENIRKGDDIEIYPDYIFTSIMRDNWNALTNA